MAPNKSHNRVSSLLSFRRDDSASTISQASDASQRHEATQGAKSPFERYTPPSSRLVSSSSLQAIPIDTTSNPLDPRPAIAAEGNIRSRSQDRYSDRAVSQGSREGSRSRPQTPLGHSRGDSISRPSTPDSGKLGKKKGLFLGKGGRLPEARTDDATKAWIAGLKEHVPYALAPLCHGNKLPDLWNENGDTLVYLFPQSTGRGPSIKIHSSLLESSSPLQELIYSVSEERTQAVQQLRQIALGNDATNLTIHPHDGSSPPSVHSGSFYDVGANLSALVLAPTLEGREKTLLLLLGFEHDYSDSQVEPQGDDIELLVLYRNFFAFLSGGALVATARQVSLYSIFIGVGSMLKRYQFDVGDGSSFGEVASNSFNRYCDELRLADIRSSREKTIEAIVLGEHMRSWTLYNEGFVHAAGRLGDIKSVNSPKYNKISPTTANRLERATLDLRSRLLTVRSRLQDFDFTAMFSGLANSQTAVESKIVRFKEWKLAFGAFKRQVLAHYRHKYGAWPPKAGSKKHNFEGSGLNRLVLRELYQDFCDLYDMLVDRSSMTTRTANLVPLDDDAFEFGDVAEATRHALRRVEGEYDSSDVPVHPPIPFDVPLVPTFTQSFNRSHAELSNENARSTKKLTENEVNEILLGAYNRESMKATPWIQDFIAFERRMGTGKTLDDIVNLRTGQWLFIYAVLQSLPLTVIDARDVQFTDGVEDFLCLAPRGGRPWMKEDTSQSWTWYNVANAGGFVSFPGDLVDHSTEGIYQRSHCWKIAAQWGDRLEDPPAYPNGRSSESPQPTLAFQDLSPPYLSPFVSPDQRPASPVLRSVSPAFLERPQSRSSMRSSMILGLEATDALPSFASRPVSTYNPNTTFDSILGNSQSQKTQGKKVKKEK